MEEEKIMARLKTGLILLSALLFIGLVFMDAGEIDMEKYLMPPEMEHIFGYDSLGRDLFSRSMYGLVVSFSISLLGSILSMVISLLIVFIARKDGILGTLVYSFSKAVRTVPSVVLGLFLFSFPGNALFKLLLVLSLSSGAATAIFMLPLIKKTGREDYITAERSLGIRERRIYLSHIVPSLFPLLMEQFTRNMISMIITESSLSFLGLGLDPGIPTLGRLLSEGRSLLLSHPYVVLFPSLLFVFLSLSLMLTASGLRELDSSLH